MNTRRTPVPPKPPSPWLMPVLGAAVTLVAVAVLAPSMKRYPWEVIADWGSATPAELAAGDDDSAAAVAPTPSDQPQPTEALAIEPPPPEDDGGIRYTVQPGDTISGILDAHGVSGERVQGVIAASQSADYDLVKKLRADRELTLRMDKGGDLTSLAFAVDPETVLELRLRARRHRPSHPSAPH